MSRTNAPSFPCVTLPEVFLSGQRARPGIYRSLFSGAEIRQDEDSPLPFQHDGSRVPYVRLTRAVGGVFASDTQNSIACHRHSRRHSLGAKESQTDTMETSRVSEWVQLCANWCEPDWVHWCDGSAREKKRLVKLSAAAAPAPAGAEEKCVTPAEAIRRIAVECGGCLRGQTLFVVPYVRFGDEPGVLVTDSAARAALVCRTASVGAKALEQMETGCPFTAHLYLTGREDGSRSPVSIRCHLSGPEVIDTSCRTPSPRRVALPMEADRTDAPAAKPSCLSCLRLCPTRAQAIVSAARLPHA